MSLYYVEDNAGRWQWIEADGAQQAAEQVAGPGVKVTWVASVNRGYPAMHYRVQVPKTGRVICTLDVTAERHIIGAESEDAE